MQDWRATFSKVTSFIGVCQLSDFRFYSSEMDIVYCLFRGERPRDAGFLLSKMRQDRIAKQFRLARAIVSPDLEHDVGTASGSVFFDFLHALVGRTRDGTDFAE